MIADSRLERSLANASISFVSLGSPDHTRPVRFAASGEGAYIGLSELLKDRL